MYLSFWLEKRAESLVVGPGKASMAEPGVGEANLEGDSCGDGEGPWLGVEGCWPKWRLC